MFAKLLRLFHTLRFIKGIQLYYQLWYRIKNRFISIHWYNKYLNESLVSIDVQVAYILQSKQQQYLGNNSFELIGLKQSFEYTIDWNYQGHGKLWNYNLQYFGYLLDENIPSEERFRLLIYFSEQLLSGNVKPEPYPVSLRVVNTLLFHSRYPITDKVVLKALFKQIDYLANNLEYHLLANHILENAFSLFIASIYLSNKQLFESAQELLIIQLNEQILSDGGHYECSPMYHSDLLSKLLISVAVARKATWDADEIIVFLEGKASHMLGWINEYSFPDGSWALMNDASEKIAPTTESLNNAATALNILPICMKLGNSGFRKIVGSNWELLIKVGGVTPAYQPGHVHADVSSFCLWHEGRQVIVDSGVSTYSVTEQRSIERGTRNHNTISINGFNQSDIWGGFRVGKRAIVKSEEDLIDCIQISIQPFFNTKCKHIRKFLKLDDRRFQIEDTIIHPTNYNITAVGNIQFEASISINYKNDVLYFNDSIIHFVGLNEVAIRKGVYSTCFHQSLSGPRLEYRASLFSSLTFEFI